MDGDYQLEMLHELRKTNDLLGTIGAILIHQCEATETNTHDSRPLYSILDLRKQEEMIIGIVGSEAIKFTEAGELEAKKLIRHLVSNPTVIEVVSGDCHLGGVDIWAQEITEELGKKFTAFTPAKRNWENGYRPRNLRIAHRSDEVHCITVRRLPSDYEGMRFPSCYHCKMNTHIKSGGCWTMKRAKQEGKKGILHVIENQP